MTMRSETLNDILDRIEDAPWTQIRIILRACYDRALTLDDTSAADSILDAIDLLEDLDN